ncbi:hypothetical protein GCM10011413_11200 [Pedobacter psychrotolerans]|nr:hypothetical protein GCM10011413_11200 [Pedobacter psychrotolerans]
MIISVHADGTVYDQVATVDLTRKGAGIKSDFKLRVEIQQLPLRSLLIQPGLASIYDQLTSAGLLPSIAFQQIIIEGDTAKNNIRFTSIAGTSEWALPGFNQLKLKQLSFIYYRTYSRITKGGSAIVTFGGRLNIGQTGLEASVQTGTDRPGQLIIRTKQEVPLQKSLDEISAFLLGQSISAILPESFSNVPGVYLCDLYTLVNLRELTIISTGITLEVREAWTLMEGICRTGKSSLSLRLDKTASGVSSVLTVISEITLVENLTTTLLIEVDNLTANWLVSLNAALRLPRLKDIDVLLGLSTLSNSGLPASLLEQQLQIDIRDLKMQFSPAEKTFNEFSLTIASEQLWEVMSGIKIGNTLFELSWTKQEGILTGSVSGELLLGNNLKVALSGEKLPGGIMMAGNFTANSPLKLTEVLSYLFPGFQMPDDLFEVKIISGSVKIDTSNGAFDLDIDNDSYLNLAPLARLESKKLTVSYKKGDNRCTISTKGAFRLINLSEGVAEASYLLNLEGTLKANIEKDQNSVGFVSDEGKSSIELPTLIPGIDGKNVLLRFGLQRIELKQEADKGWKFSATTETQLRNLNKNIASIFPDKMTASLTISKTEQVITLDHIVRPLTFVLPEVEFPTGKVQLGTLAIGLSNFTFALRKEAEASVDIALGLPSNLNKMFGAMPDPADTSKTKPAFELFRTYVEGDADSYFKLTFAATASGGVKLRLGNSPFKVKAFEIKDGYWYCDLGYYGKLKIMLPVLTYKNGAFSGRISFEREGELRFPMYLFKQIIKDQFKLAKAAEFIPDAIPITNIAILNDSGHLNVATILQALNLTGDDPTSKIVRSIISAVDGVLDELPERLRDVYMKHLTIPEKFYAEVAVGADGGINIDMGVEGNKQQGTDVLRLLFPAAIGPLPVLNGIELRGFSVGTTMGGSLLTCSMDMVVDQFDLLTLGSALLRATTPWKESLPDARQVQRTYTVSKLSMIIIYQTYVPIPIPVFYDELGYDYCGIEGIRMAGHIKFPQPRLNIVALLKRIGELVRFFKEPGFALPETLPEAEKDLDFRFTVSKTFLQMPEYLGGAVIGRNQTDFFSISGYEIVTQILNDIKFFKVNKLIQSMPIDWRINSAKTPANSFGINATLAYAITTPEEFLLNKTAIARLLSSLNMPGADDNMAAVLHSFVPSTVTKDTQGMIALINGQLNIASVLQFKSRFGLAIIQNQGFATYIHMQTGLLNLLETKLEGLVSIDTYNKANPVMVKGTALLRFPAFNHTMLEGELQYPASEKPHTFYFSGKFSLLPSAAEVGLNSPAGISSHSKVFISKDEFLLDQATMRLTLPGLGELYSSTTIKISATEQLFYTRTIIWGKNIALSISNTAANGFTMKGDMDRIEWLGGWLVLEAAEESGRGPAMLVAVNNDMQLTDLYVSARISLFKLTSSQVKLELKRDTWTFALKSTTAIFGIKSEFNLACLLKSDYSRLTAQSSFTVGFKHIFGRKSFWLFSIFTWQWYEVVVFDGFTISGDFIVRMDMDMYNPAAATDTIRQELEAVRIEMAGMEEAIEHKKAELAPKVNGYKRITDDVKKYRWLLELQQSMTDAEKVKSLYEAKHRSGGDPEAKKQFLQMKEDMLREVNNYLLVLSTSLLENDAEKRLFLYRLNYIDTILWNASDEIGSYQVKNLIDGGAAPDYDFVQQFFTELVQLKNKYAARYIPVVTYTNQEKALQDIAEQLTDIYRTRQLFEAYINRSSDRNKEEQFNTAKAELLSLLNQYVDQLNAIGFTDEDEKRIYISRLYVLDRVVANFNAYGSHAGTMQDIARAMRYIKGRESGEIKEKDMDLENQWLLLLAAKIYKKKVDLINDQIRNHFMLDADENLTQMMTLEKQMEWLNQQVIPDMVEMKALEEKQQALQHKLSEFESSQQTTRISIKFNSALEASINDTRFRLALPEIALYVTPTGNSIPDLISSLQTHMVNSITSNLWEVGTSIISGKPMGRAELVPTAAPLTYRRRSTGTSQAPPVPEGYDASLDISEFIKRK